MLGYSLKRDPAPRFLQHSSYDLAWCISKECETIDRKRIVLSYYNSMPCGYYYCGDVHGYCARCMPECYGCHKMLPVDSASVITTRTGLVFCRYGLLPAPAETVNSSLQPRMRG